MQERITSTYLHKLQGIYNKIGNRGLCIDSQRMKYASIHIAEEITKALKVASDQWGCHVYIGAANDDGSDDSVNLNATQGEKALLKKLQNLGYEIPKITRKNSEGDYETKYSTGELTLQKMLIQNQFKYVGSDPAIRAILKVRELGKLRSAYLNSRLYQAPDGNLLYFSSYNATGTLTGRRSSKKNTFGYGNNGQNFPKHGVTAKLFRRCIVARPGNIFLFVDQKSAEEWPVNALANNQIALNELRAGVNRHIKRAIYVFGIDPKIAYADGWKDDAIEYYLGKKLGHANNYGMKGNRMSDSLVQEGIVIAPTMCQMLLDKTNLSEPNIQGVFHKYIREQIFNTRILKTPFGRERQFLGVRPNDNNYAVFNEAFAYIPQSTVGDNTGFAVQYLESKLPTEQRSIVQESHDSIGQDIASRVDNIWYYLQSTVRSFSRVIRFHNGIEVEIPIEAEIGYDFATTVKIKDLSYEGVEQALNKLNALRTKELDTHKVEILSQVS